MTALAAAEKAMLRARPGPPTVLGIECCDEQAGAIADTKQQSTSRRKDVFLLRGLNPCHIFIFESRMHTWLRPRARRRRAPVVCRGGGVQEFDIRKLGDPKNRQSDVISRLPSEPPAPAPAPAPASPAHGRVSSILATPAQIETDARKKSPRSRPLSVLASHEKHIHIYIAALLCFSLSLSLEKRQNHVGATMHMQKRNAKKKTA